MNFSKHVAGQIHQAHYCLGSRHPDFSLLRSFCAAVKGLFLKPFTKIPNRSAIGNFIDYRQVKKAHQAQRVAELAKFGKPNVLIEKTAVSMSLISFHALNLILVSLL